MAVDFTSLLYRGYRLVETGWLRAEERGQIHLDGKDEAMVVLLTASR
jgi:hypothetical protein